MLLINRSLTRIARIRHCSRYLEHWRSQSTSRSWNVRRLDSTNSFIGSPKNFAWGSISLDPFFSRGICKECGWPRDCPYDLLPHEGGLSTCKVRTIYVNIGLPTHLSCAHVAFSLLHCTSSPRAPMLGLPRGPSSWVVIWRRRKSMDLDDFLEAPVCKLEKRPDRVLKIEDRKATQETVA